MTENMRKTQVVATNETNASPEFNFNTNYLLVKHMRIQQLFHDYLMSSYYYYYLLRDCALAFLQGFVPVNIFTMQ